MATIGMEKIGAWFSKSSEVPKDQQPFWQTLESLNQMGIEKKIDLTVWLAAVSDTLHSALPGNSKVLAEFDTLCKQTSRDIEAGVASPQSGAANPPSNFQNESKLDEEDRRKRALGIIQLAQKTMMLNRPSASGLDQRIHNLIVQEHLKSWWFRLPILLLIILVAALFGIDWYYANRAKQVLADMEQHLNKAKDLMVTETSDLKKAVADMQKQVEGARGLLSSKDSELQGVLSNAQTKINTARDKGIGLLDETAKKAVEDVRAQQVENARAQKLEIAQIRWTGWLLARGYGIALLSLVFSIAAFVFSIAYSRSRKKALAA